MHAKDGNVEGFMLVHVQGHLDIGSYSMIFGDMVMMVCVTLF